MGVRWVSDGLVLRSDLHLTVAATEVRANWPLNLVCNICQLCMQPSHACPMDGHAPNHLTAIWHPSDMHALRAVMARASWLLSWSVDRTAQPTVIWPYMGIARGHMTIYGYNLSTHMAVELVCGQDCTAYCHANIWIDYTHIWPYDHVGLWTGLHSLLSCQYMDRLYPYMAI